MMRTLRIWILFLTVLVLAIPILAVPGSYASDSPWITMRAGARPTYMGIHGGTMPVSLLVSDDGSSLLTFVGRTGNDFLEVLHRTEFQLPSILKKTAQNSTQDAMKTSTVLQAGNTKVSMPVLVITGLGYHRETRDTAELLPFGFSEKPVSIEGRVHLPRSVAKKQKQYRLFFEPGHLTPR